MSSVLRITQPTGKFIRTKRAKEKLIHPSTSTKNESSAENALFILYMISLFMLVGLLELHFD